MEPDIEPRIVTFEAKFELDPPGTPATPRPADRPRGVAGGATHEGVLTSFTPTEEDTAFAKELANSVLEFVQNHPAGMSAEQLAALIQQFVARRSA